MKMSNQKLKKYLRQFDIVEQHRLLKNLYMKCFDLTKGNESITTEMMEKLEKKSYVQLDYLDVTQYKYITKQEKIFNEVEKNLEELFTSNFSSNQKPLINNNKISLLSESRNEDFICSGDSMTIKPSKVQGIKKSKGVSETLSSTWLSDAHTISNENTQNLTSQSKIQKCHNNCTENEIIEPPRLNYSELIDLTIDDLTISNENTQNMTSQSKIQKCHNNCTENEIIEPPRLNYSELIDLTIDDNLDCGNSSIQLLVPTNSKTISKMVSAHEKKNKEAKNVSNNSSNKHNNSPHRAFAVNKINKIKCNNIFKCKKDSRASADINCNNIVKCRKDSQKTNSKINTTNEKEKKTEKIISNDRLKRKNILPYNASADIKCNNIDKWEKDSQKTTSKMDTINEKKKNIEKLVSNDRLKRKNISPHRASADIECKRLKIKNNSPHSYFSTYKCNDIIDCKKDSQKYHLPKFIEESNINKCVVLEQVAKKKSSKVQMLCSAENSTDLKQNQNTNTKCIVDSSHCPIVSMNFAPGITSEKLRIIIFKNFSFYNRNGLCKLATIFTNNDLLLKSHENWHPDTVLLIETLLEDLFKSLNHFQFKNIVFMACLSVLYRRIYFSSKSKKMYKHFILFINVIETCAMGVDDYFWKPLLPDGWDKVFLNGCLLVDYILYGAMPNSMYLHVDCDPMPNVKVLHNNTFLNEVQSQNVLNSASSKSKQLAIENSAIDSSSDPPALKMITDHDGNPDILFHSSSSKTIERPMKDELDSICHQLERPISIKNLSTSCFSLWKTFASIQNNKKRKLSVLQTNFNHEVVKKNPSHYIIKQLNVQNMCLQTPKYSRSINRPKQRNGPHTRTLLNEGIQNKPSGLLHKINEDSSKVCDEPKDNYPLQITKSGFSFKNSI